VCGLIAIMLRVYTCPSNNQCTLEYIIVCASFLSVLYNIKKDRKKTQKCMCIILSYCRCTRKIKIRSVEDLV
jgi:hypothetical protein